MAFREDVEVVIVRSGDVMTIYPAANTIPEMIARLQSLPTPPRSARGTTWSYQSAMDSDARGFSARTNVAIHLRDGDASITEKVAALTGAVLMSIVTRVELEGGVYREPVYAAVLRAWLDTLLGAIPTLAFDDAAADAYREIVAALGYFRGKLLDRMIVARALVHRATLVTQNPADFSDIPLPLVVW